MIGIVDENRMAEAFERAAVEVTRLIHFGAYDGISDMVDMSSQEIMDIKKFFDKNPYMLPDNPYEFDAEKYNHLCRVHKINDLTYDIEYDFVRGNKVAYMSLCMRFTNDAVEPYTLVTIQQIRKNDTEEK